MNEFNEQINVWVYFKNRTVYPFMFYWKGRQIKVDSVNLVHTSKDGSTTFYHFSLSSGENFYKLRFNSDSLKWFLEAIEEG